MKDEEEVTVARQREGRGKVQPSPSAKSIAICAGSLVREKCSTGWERQVQGAISSSLPPGREREERGRKEVSKRRKWDKWKEEIGRQGRRTERSKMMFVRQ